MKLANIKKNQIVVIEQISSNNAQYSKLFNFGILPGVCIKVLQNVGGSVIIALGENRISLGKQISQIIQVK
jgi:Fe2+ transport system protein FeoA